MVVVMISQELAFCTAEAQRLFVHYDIISIKV
jgi:hypothetical protein